MSARDETGTTLIELLVGIIGFIAIFTTVMMITTVATRSQERISDRVAVDQRARPVMTRIMDALHSSCVAPRVVPVFSGSTASSITFMSKSGSEVNPLPNRHQISFVAGSPPTLQEVRWPGTGGTPPVFTYSSTPMTGYNPPRPLLTDVTQGPGGGFRYYGYDSAGRLNSTPFSPPLDATEAAATAYVTVSMNVRPSGGTSTLDGNSPITLTNSVDLRLESAAQGTENRPCDS